MGKTVGIDLGTTNSVVAFSRDGKDVRVLSNAENEYQTPSIVSLTGNGRQIVGTNAKNNGPMNPLNTINSIKRLMGKIDDDDDVKELIDKVQYKIVPDDDGNDVRVMFNEKKRSPIEISAMILRKLKEDAERRLNDEVTSAVITVPAYFTDAQKYATRRAGLEAGLIVRRIIPEPTAAAKAFGLSLDENDIKNILVFDLGGGTFDVSVLLYTAGQYSNVALQGNNWLGGDDFDNKIVEYVLDYLYEQYAVDGRDDPSFMFTLRERAERAKRTLSVDESAYINIATEFRDSDDKRINISLEITRIQFEDWIRQYIDGPLLVRKEEKIDKAAIPLTLKAIEESKLLVEDIDHVLLVGGSTSIPLVKERLAGIFGSEKIMEVVNPMNAVAEGAAILASQYTGIVCPKCGHRNPEDATTCQNKEKQCDFDLKDGLNTNPIIDNDINIISMSYGIALRDGSFNVVLPKGVPYPTNKGEEAFSTFYTAEQNQKFLYIPIYQAEDPPEPKAENNKLQATFKIDLKEKFSEELKVKTPVTVKMSIDKDSIISVHIECKGVSLVSERLEPGKTKPNEKKLPEENKFPKLEWEDNLGFNMFIGGMVLEYRPLIDPILSGKLEKLIAEGKRAIDSKNESLGKRVLADISFTIEEIVLRSENASIIETLVEAEIVTRINVGDMEKRQELNAKLNMYKDRLRSGRRREADALYKEIKMALGEFNKKYFSEMNQEGVSLLYKYGVISKDWDEKIDEDED